jgi:hypothetical protein
MREKRPIQMPLMSHILDHPQSRELEVISGIIAANSTICEHILQDLNRGEVRVPTRRRQRHECRTGTALCHCKKGCLALLIKIWPITSSTHKACVGFAAIP